MNGSKFIFCEGGDDLAVINGIGNSINASGVKVEPFKGKDNLRNFLKSVQARPEFTRNEVAAFGIIRDADADGAAAFQSVCDALLASGFKAPASNGGFAIGPIKTGVLIVSSTTGQGTIEDLCLSSVDNRPEFPCVEEYFRCIADKSARKNFSSKAKVRVWMASQIDYDARVGLAAEKGYWPWENPAFEAIKEFLRQL